MAMAGLVAGLVSNNLILFAFFQVTTSYQNTNIASEGELYGAAFEHIVSVTSHHWTSINT